MKIKFVQNFRGRETKEKFFQIGEEIDGLDMAADLVKRGVAVEVKLPAPKEEPKTVVKKSVRKSAGSK